MFHFISYRQLQKMVHDIKNNEGGIMNKIKKLKVKAPPSVPRRDYAPGKSISKLLGLLTNLMFIIPS
uniref:B cell linker n=1 Tax=Capra hircus TaxID=9925 RepID=A0A452F0F5_CAPHI